MSGEARSSTTSISNYPTDYLYHRRWSVVWSLFFAHRPFALLPVFLVFNVSSRAYSWCCNLRFGAVESRSTRFYSMAGSGDDTCSVALSPGVSSVLFDRTRGRQITEQTSSLSVTQTPLRRSLIPS